MVFEDYRGIDQDFYSGVSEDGYRELFEQAMYRLTRLNEEMEWKTTHGFKPKTKAFLLTNFQESIPFSELSLSPETDWRRRVWGGVSDGMEWKRCCREETESHKVQ